MVHSANIFKFFTLLPEQSKNDKSLLYICNVCRDAGKKEEDGSDILIKVYGSTTSNLHKHLNKNGHELAKEELSKLEISSPVSKKRKIDTDLKTNEPDLIQMGAVNKVHKYNINRNHTCWS